MTVQNSNWGLGCVGFIGTALFLVGGIIHLSSGEHVTLGCVELVGGVAIAIATVIGLIVDSDYDRSAFRKHLAQYDQRVVEHAKTTQVVKSVLAGEPSAPAPIPSAPDPEPIPSAPEGNCDCDDEEDPCQPGLKRRSIPTRA